MRNHLLALLASTALVAAGAPAMAQSNPSPQTQRTQTTQQNAAQSQQQDATQTSRRNQQAQQQIDPQTFVEKAAMSNRFEIRSARAAVNSNNNDVADFAQTLLDDHRQAAQKLQAAAGNIDVPTRLDQRHLRRLQRLQRLSGNRFDHRFITQQIRAHRQAIALFSNFINEAGSPSAQSDQTPSDQNQARTTSGTNAGDTGQQSRQDLVQFAQETLPTLREHLQTALDLRNSMGSGNVAQNTGDQTADQRGMMRNGQTGQQQRGTNGRTLTIQQGQPRVTVRNPQAQVSVQQPQPQITIRQAPPTITIQQSQPEVIVRMPKPDVNVTDRRPQVTVNVPKPQLRVQNQDEQAQVNYQQRNDRQANVQFEGQRPQVDFQRTGQPKVIYHRAQGQPNVRYEQMGDNQQANTDQAKNDYAKQTSQDVQTGSAMQNQQTASRQSQTPGQNAQQNADRQQSQNDQTANRDWVTRATALANDAGDNPTAASQSGQAQVTQVSAQRLMNMSVYNGRGQDLGDVEDLVTNQGGNQAYVVLAHGGFLGLFQDEVALPVNRLTLRGNRLVVSGLTEREVENMADWERRLPNSQNIGDNQMINVKTAQ